MKYGESIAREVELANRRWYGVDQGVVCERGRRIFSRFPELSRIRWASKTTGSARRHFKLSDGMAVREIRLALPDFYDVAVGIANVAARLSILLLWPCDEVGSSISP